MKKQPKKLVLAKETMRNLDVNLGYVAGATTPENGCTGLLVCAYSSPYYCPREPATRGSACNP
jgi:hypothetical protein